MPLRALLLRLRALSSRAARPAPLALALRLPWPGPATASAARRCWPARFAFAGETGRGRFAALGRGAERGVARGAAWFRLARRSRGASQSAEATQRGARMDRRLAPALRSSMTTVAWRADVMGDRLLAWIEHLRSSLRRPASRGARFAAKLRAPDAPPRPRRGRRRRRGSGAPQGASRGLVAAAAALGPAARGSAAALHAPCATRSTAQFFADGGHRARSPRRAARRRCAALIEARTRWRAASDVPARSWRRDRPRGADAALLPPRRRRLALFNGAAEGDPARYRSDACRAPTSRAAPPLPRPTAGFERLQGGRHAGAVRLRRAAAARLRPRRPCRHAWRSR